MRAAARRAHVCTQPPGNLSELSAWLTAYLVAPENAARNFFTLRELLAAADVPLGATSELAMREALWRSTLASGRRADGDRERGWFRTSTLAPLSLTPTAQAPEATQVTVNLQAFTDAFPAVPPSDADDATFWALCARADMIELQAACTLTAQLRAGARLPKSLGLTLTNLERMLRQKIRTSITDHDKAGGTDTALLIVELNAISVVTA